MKTYKNVIKILMVMVAIGLMGIADAKAQNQRMMEFQDEFSKYQTQYRDLFYCGKHKETMAPLASCIAMLDTTKNLYYFVCKKLNRFNPESIYRNNDPADDVRLIPVGFVSNNWKCDTTTDPDVFWAKP